MQAQPLSQRQCPTPPAVLHDVAVDHLRLCLLLRIRPVELIEDKSGAVARDICHAEMRIERNEVDLRHEPQDVLTFAGG
jgi:hypothetical protein